MSRKQDAQPRGESRNSRLFIGVFPTGISYADRTQEEHGDYKRLAFLSYRTLELEWYGNVPPDQRNQIISHAGTIQAMRGQAFQISSSGQTVKLGE